MKYYTCLALLLFVSSSTFAQTTAPQHTWNVTLKVVDENGSPVVGANTSVGFFTNSQSTSFDGRTDSNGVFSATHAPANDFNELGFEVKKDGFYSTRIGYTLFPPYDPAKWNITQTLILKKIGKPVAMYAKQINSLVVPEFNKAIGYDLMVGDWVGSYGKGVNTDLFITEKHADPQSGYILSVSFPKPGDGIQEFIVSEVERGSGFHSAHEAPVSGYQSEVSQTTTTNPNRNFYFRVRTKLDEQGNVVSARYGKIYGDLAQFTYYFNPTPNDRNIEFDPKQNLLGGLQSFETVTAP